MRVSLMIDKFVCVSKTAYHVQQIEKTLHEKPVMFNKWKKLCMIVLMRIKSGKTVTCGQ